ncbi:MAG: dTDP-4-dehydrorhamnose reductase, partial [Arenicella sp.]|nr:dTDP-4-dehydrorhamnose reductase [Arenicella sp.]
MKTVLIIGSNGQVSTYLQRALRDDYSLLVAGRDSIDLSRPQSVRAALDGYAPDLIINPAAYTAVDLAEQEAELATRINCDSVAELAQFCHDTMTPLIHFSTDYVFSGDASEPYSEDAPASPSGVYGRSKYQGEQAILHAAAPAIILRTSWVYSNHGKNFYRTMLALAETRDQLTVVADQVGAPTFAGSIANATKSLVDIICQQGGIPLEQQGIYHFSCAGQTSWYEFANQIFSQHGIDGVEVMPISTEQYPTPAKRPAFSVLDNSKLYKVFHIALPDWEVALK